MKDEEHDVSALISGYLDDELEPEERAEVERRLATDDAFRREFDKMKRLVDATSVVRFEQPPDEVWDTFLDGVYNRLERQTGWVIFIIGIAALTLWGIYWFLTEPWGPALIKVLIATPIVGLAIVFISVLRQRLQVAKTDRYSREVNR